jgi:hypothetical protein
MGAEFAGANGTATNMNRWHKFSRRAAFALTAAMLLLAGAWTAHPAAAQSASSTVRLIIDYGDGTIKTITNIPWAKGNTVLDAMNAAKSRPHGIMFGYSGSGATALLTDIDGVASTGGGAARKNWQYWINTTYGDRSFAAFELQALDVVFWRYATEQGK